MSRTRVPRIGSNQIRPDVAASAVPRNHRWTDQPPVTTPRTMVGVPLPAKMARLPRNEAGYPIPWFVATLDDGTRDFRVADGEKASLARRLGLCWVCGQITGAHKAFTIGPMCAVNRISSEPPAHRDCAVFSARACPFLATPRMVRREKGLPEETGTPGGLAIMRNPGVAMVWVTKSYRAWYNQQVGQPGWLYSIGEPEDILFYREGRTATRAEILESLETGLPALQDACQQDPHPDRSLAHLDLQYRQALQWVPA